MYGEKKKASDNGLAQGHRTHVINFPARLLKEAWKFDASQIGDMLEPA